MEAPKTYEGQPIDSMTEQQIIKALYVISSDCTPHNYMLANELLNELKWYMRDYTFGDFKKELLKDFPLFYGEEKEVKVISIVNIDINQKILDRKRPDFTKQVFIKTLSHFKYV